MEFQRPGRRLLVSVVAAALCLSTFSAGPSTAAADTVKVGVLQSLTGTMAISEVTVKNATLLAIDQINAAGGVLGKQIEPVVEDGASDPAMFAQKAQKLIQQDQVVTVFGGWTSASRKAMLPVFERFKGLLWYPVQFEGNECSPNIMYSGAQPNQQILPALQWAEEKGYKNIFLLGSDYVFPRTANLILKKHIVHDGKTVAGEEYVPLGGTDFSAVINKIQARETRHHLQHPQRRQQRLVLQADGRGRSSLGETAGDVVQHRRTGSQGDGPVAARRAATPPGTTSNRLPDPVNKKFVAAYQAKYPGSPVDDPMAHGYLDVYAWAAAVKKAGTFDRAKVRKAAQTIALLRRRPRSDQVRQQSEPRSDRIRRAAARRAASSRSSGSRKARSPPCPTIRSRFPGKTCVL